MNTELFLPSEQIPHNAIMIPKLVHGSQIVTVELGTEDLSDCDALITENRSLSLGIRTADCAPICFSDGTKIGIAHVGWRGLCIGLVQKMRIHFDVANLSVYVGPFLHSFEIQKDFCYDQIAREFGKHFLEEKENKLVFNFKNALDSLLPPQTVYDSRSTGTDLSFPGYRRDKTKNRFVTIVSFANL